MSSSEELLLRSLTNYFQKHARHRDILYKIVSGQYSISLRVIDWFITHYAKAMNILYWIDESKNTIVEQMPNNAATLAQYKKIHLYYEYRAQLKSYTKMHFDPFRRHERITFVLENTKASNHGATSPRAEGSAPRVIETTVGQLNFFRWALQNHVIDYIHQYLPQIEGHMSMHQSKHVSVAASSSIDAKKVYGKAGKGTKKHGSEAPSTARITTESSCGTKTKPVKKATRGKPVITASPTHTCRVRFD